MHIKIETERRRGLRIIEEIPDIEFCKIQGHNGIGKTNAIKLLALCTGQTPFRRDSASWLSFRDQLLAGRVHISGLRGGEELIWDLTPDQWPVDPNEPLGDLVGSFRINGTSARSQDVGGLLRVYHIVAADTPQNVLSARVLEAQKEISAWGTIRQSRVNALDESIDSVVTLISDASPEKFSADLLMAQELGKRAETIKIQLEEASQRVKLLKRAAEVSDHLIQVRGRGPEMDTQLNELTARLEGLDREKESLDQKIADASARQHRDAEAEKNFVNAQKYLDRHDRILRTARTSLENLAAAAEVDPRRDVIEQAHQRASEKLTELTNQLPRVHAAPLILEVLDDLIGRLDEADGESLGAASLLTDELDTEVYSVASLRNALQGEREKLQQRTPSADAARLNEDISRTRNLLDSLVQMTEALNEFEQAEAGLTRAKERLKAAADGLPEQAARTLDELMTARNKLDQDSAEVQTNQARLAHARELLGGGLDEGSLNLELAQLCKQLGVRAPRVKGQFSSETAKLEEIVRSEAQTSQQADRAQQAVEKKGAVIRQVVEILLQDEEFKWVRNSRSEISTLLDADVETQAVTLQVILDQISRARNNLHRIDSSVHGTGDALIQLQGDLQSGSGLHERTNPLDHAVRSWLDEDVRQWFNDNLVRKALFDGGSNVRLDPLDMSICWTNERGEEERRPLSGFSSGQQVFAYTQAQVAKLDREEFPAENRLIALDEFGSFLDWDRMSSLVDFLRAREHTGTKDQVVVILPLEENAPRHRGQSDVVNEQIHSLELRGYFAEELRT